MKLFVLVAQIICFAPLSLGWFCGTANKERDTCIARFQAAKSEIQDLLALASVHAPDEAARLARTYDLDLSYHPPYHKIILYSLLIVQAIGCLIFLYYRKKKLVLAQRYSDQVDKYTALKTSTDNFNQIELIKGVVAGIEDNRVHYHR